MDWAEDALSGKPTSASRPGFLIANPSKHNPLYYPLIV